MLRKFTGLLAALLLASPLALAATPAPEGAAVYFIEPADGAEVTSPVTVKFGLKGMGVAPAGWIRPPPGTITSSSTRILRPPGSPCPRATTTATSAAARPR